MDRSAGIVLFAVVAAFGDISFNIIAEFRESRESIENLHAAILITYYQYIVDTESSLLHRSIELEKKISIQSIKRR